jgi:glycosyltransferase involved in cell wall biosynthesis
VNRLRAVSALRPWYDLETKHPGHLKSLFHNLYRISSFYDIHLVVTFNIEIAQYGFLLSQYYPWIQDLGDSMVLQNRRARQKAGSLKKRLSLGMRAARENKFEWEMVQKAFSNIFVAEDDAQLYGDSSARCEVIPNGIDSDYFDPDAVREIAEEEPYVIFTGHMSFLPNQDAVRHFALDIFPEVRKRIPGLRFKIVGADPGEAVLALNCVDGVDVTGTVPDIRPYLAGASAFVCPMRMGSGIKNKILEAMSMKVPVVSTSLASKGIAHLPPNLVTIADDEDGFASSLSNLVQNPGGLGVIGELSRNFVKSHYSWEKTTHRYRDLFYGNTGSQVQGGGNELAG